MSGHLEKEALKLGAIKVAEIEKADVEGGLISRDWEITFELDGFTVKHGVNCSLEDMYNWIKSLNLPEYTETEKDALDAPQNGQMIYNSTNNRIEIRQNGAWVYITNVSSA